MHDFGVKLDVTAGAVLKWEKDADKPVGNVNEIAIRLFVAEKLGLAVSTKYSELTRHEATRRVEAVII